MAMTMMLTNFQTNSSVSIGDGVSNMYTLGYMYGMASSFIVYTGLSILFPVAETMADGSEES